MKKSPVWSTCACTKARAASLSGHGEHKIKNAVHRTCPDPIGSHANFSAVYALINCSTVTLMDPAHDLTGSQGNAMLKVNFNLSSVRYQDSWDNRSDWTRSGTLQAINLFTSEECIPLWAWES
ncbi:hypothetical protein RRG08_049235 [Elysia crispata]|uniref:Uncharacterized protein n=1 Tax=Elysia crispata TaxID=231223 RepID=A0AAE0YU45_9GAST|nr:hypothetical protein RRG08_049235 [Elysia crispata]